jgi:cytoskeletal protein CcmA (bactofilin family)
MRVASSTLTGSGTNEISAIRAYLGTQKAVHVQNSLVKKIKPLATELRRPSILRASGHTFEYLGYGPGNYSTALPQVQIRTLTEREDFLAQAQEKSAGQVVYTGMNSDGDFFIGNTKYSASSGKQQTFDIPIPTVTGQDPSRLSVVFDEVIVKERILVEGGSSNQILSQFDGPVTFNENVIINDELKLTDNLIITGLIESKNDTQSTSCTTGAITTQGGLGVEKNVNICGDLGVGGTARFTGGVQFNSGLFADVKEGAFLGKPNHEWSGVWAAGIGIGTEGVAGGTEPADRTIRGITGDLILGVRNEIDTDSGAVGYGTEVRIEDNLRVNLDTTLDRNLNVIGLTTFKSNTRHEDGVRALFGSTPPSGASGDLEIYHDGSDGYIDNENGDFFLQNHGSNNSSDMYFRAKDGVESIILRHDAEVELYYNSVERLETTPTGVYITGITTTTVGFVPDTDLGAYLGTRDLRFSEAHIGDIRIAEGTGANTDRTITTLSGSLFLDSDGGTVNITDNADIDGNLNVDGTSQFDGNVNMSSNLTVAGVLDVNTRADIDNIRIDGNTITTTTGNLILDSAGGLVDINDNVDILGSLTVGGNATLGNNSSDSHTINGSVDMNHTLNVDGDADFNNPVHITDTTANTIGNPDTGALQVDGGVGVNGNMTVDGSFDVDGTTTLDTTTIDGTLDLNGTATTHLILPDGDNTRDLGSPSARWQDIYGVEFHGTLTGNTTQVNTVSTSTNATHFITFVNSDNSTAAAETLFTDGGLRYNPSTNNFEVTGDITAFASDDRLKTNRIGLTDALDKVNSLSGFTYNFNEVAAGLGFNTEIDYVGVSAQEVEKVLPEAVRPAPVDNDYITVQYEKLVPLLIEAIKELNAKVEDLEDKLSDK